MSRYTPRYFTYDEFDSKDKPGTGTLMNDELLQALDYVRQQVESPLIINSGYRTPERNERVGGSANSQHLLGNAADVHISSKAMGDLIEYWFIDYIGDKCGIGRYKNFIHLDVRGYKARWGKRNQ